MGTKLSDADSIFCAAIELASPLDRVAYLQQVCGQDEELRRRIEKLLAAHFRAGNFLEVPPAGLQRTAEPAVQEGPGTIIGPYKLLEQIGKGGFGVVFLAEQQHPVRRRVALKILKAGMDTREVIARFEAERQALAMMDHRHIAKVLDAGATDTGRPYFVMELVQGVPITEYCDRCNLPMHERLELFISVCQAVQHAHQKGIIHRDLKPTNVLVAIEDGRPSPKVIDFGVAKAVSQRLTEHTLQTAFTQMIGTPLYMSPEQAELSPLGVDTRSDIYSLGVLLYELLTGTTPFEKERLNEVAYDELRRIIREEDPPRPSARVSTLGTRAETVAENRRTDFKKLCQLVRGDLDWIVMKSLEKDRNRRYETTSGLMRDIERYLADEPVEACPPSAMYRFRKFARRNRATLITAALVTAAIVLGSVGSTWQAVRATQAERQSKTSEQQALQNAHRADAVSTFLVDAFRSTDPTKDGRTVTIAEVLDRSAKDVQDKFSDDPLTKAALLEAIGDSYRSLGLAWEALPLLEQAQKLRKDTLGADHPDTLAASRILCSAYRSCDRVKDSVDLAEKTLKLSQARFGPDDPDTYKSMVCLANSYFNARRFDESIRLFEETLKFQKTKLGTEDSDTLRTMNGLAAAYGAKGQTEKALALVEENYRLTKAKLGADHPETLLALSNLVIGYSESGRNAEALPLSEEVVKLSKAKFGPDHPSTLHCMSNLAWNYHAAGRTDDAVTLIDETIGRLKASLGADNRETLHAMEHRARMLEVQGKVGEQELAWREIIRIKPDHAMAHYTLAVALANQGRYAEAEAEYRECIRLDPRQRQPHVNLGFLFYRQNNYVEAEAVWREAVRLEPDDPKCHVNLGVVLGALKRRDEAEAEYREAIRLKPDYAVAHRNLAESLAKQAHADGLDALRDAAAAEYLRAIDLSEDGPTSRAPRIGVCRELAQWDEVFQRVLKLRPHEATLWIGRGQYHALRRQWDEATADYAKVIHARPAGAESIEYSGLLLLSGDAQDYQHFCKELADRTGQPTDAYTKLCIARSCALGAANAVDPARFVDWAAARPDGFKIGYPQHVLGLAQYRAGRYETAIGTLEDSNSRDWPGKDQNWLVMAMAHHRLGHSDEARRCLETAQQLMDNARPREPEKLPEMLAVDWIAVNVLLREAELLLKKPASEPKANATDN